MVIMRVTMSLSVSCKGYIYIHGYIYMVGQGYMGVIYGSYERERVPETTLRRSAFSSSLEVKMCMLFLTCLLCFPPLLALPTPFFPLYIYTYIHIIVYIHYNHLYPARTLMVLLGLITGLILSISGLIIKRYILSLKDG